MSIDYPDAPVSPAGFLDAFGWADYSIGHMVVRATYLPGTVRCTSGNTFQVPTHLRGSGLEGHLFINCYADIRVNDYYIGAGPPVLTVMIRSSLYGRKGKVLDEVDDVEELRASLERQYAGGGTADSSSPLVVHGQNRGIDGREEVMFIGPAADASIEAWDVKYRWDVQRQADGAIVAIHPHYYGYRHEDNFDQLRSQLEMPLSTLRTAVVVAHRVRAAANGGRIRANSGWPLLVSDADQLRRYYVQVGGYSGGRTPDKPPPATTDPCVTHLGTLDEEITLSGEWTGTGEPIFWWLPDNPCTGFGGSYARWYTFQLPYAGQLRITASSDEDTLLNLRFWGDRTGPLVAVDHVRPRAPEIVYSAGVYTFTVEVASTPLYRTGTFTLTIQPPSGFGDAE